ncbi:MAG: polymer-forming cytoskeletal protein [Chloroflexi bacterium]|nr:polymer-forming cytoskeletal protein [Chloroflexota bacterium]
MGHFGRLIIAVAIGASLALLAAMVLADPVHDMRPTVLAGAIVVFLVVRWLGRPRRPSERVTSAAAVAEPASALEPAALAPPTTGRVVVIGEGSFLTGVLYCERLVVHGRFRGTIYVGASWDRDAWTSQRSDERPSLSSMSSSS